MWMFLGEILSDDEGDEDNDEGTENEDDFVKKEMAKLDADKQAILNNSTIIAEVSAKTA